MVNWVKEDPGKKANMNANHKQQCPNFFVFKYCSRGCEPCCSQKAKET